jgi:hypothetical protein
MEKVGFHWTDYHEILYLSIFLICVEKIQTSLNLTRLTGTLHEDQCTVLIIYCSVLRRMRNVSDKVAKKPKTYILVFFLNRDVCGIMRRNIVEPGRPQMTIRRTRIACWIPKPTKTHSDYVIIIAFPLQQRFHQKKSSILRYTYIVCLVKCHFEVGRQLVS